MSESPSRTRRLVGTVVLPAAILIVLLLASGNNFFSGESTPAAPVSENATAGVPPTSAAGRIQAMVSVAIHPLGGQTYRYTYTVRNVGKVPIAGFQINGQRANLFAIRGVSRWSRFGNGVCGEKYPGVLVYWSTGSASPTVIRPGKTGRFGFDVNTRGHAADVYSLAYGQATPQFGTIAAPAPSTLPVSGPCIR